MNLQRRLATLTILSLLLFALGAGNAVVAQGDNTPPADPVSLLQTKQQDLETQLATTKAQLHQALVGEVSRQHRRNTRRRSGRRNFTFPA